MFVDQKYPTPLLVFLTNKGMRDHHFIITRAGIAILLHVMGRIKCGRGLSHIDICFSAITKYNTRKNEKDY